MRKNINKGSVYSKVETKFRKSKAIKRNKNIFDISLIDTIETHDSLIRRIPIPQSSTKQIEQQISVSFLDTTLDPHQKLQTDRMRIKTRMSTFHIDSTLPYYNQHLLSRDKIQQKKKRLITQISPQNERRYNNYSLHIPNAHKIRQFQKYLMRKDEVKGEVIHTEPIVQAQKRNRKKDIKKEQFSRQIGRKQISLKPRFSSFQMQQIPPQKINWGKSKTQSNWAKTLTGFNQLSDKEVPSQFQRIFHTEISDFRHKKQRTKDPNKSIRVYRPPNPENFKRHELCDLKFFRLQSQRKKKGITLPY